MNELTKANKHNSPRRNLAANAALTDLATTGDSAKRAGSSHSAEWSCSHPAPDPEVEAAFQAELTASRDWKITNKSYEHMSMREMHVRAGGIFWCGFLALCVIGYLVLDYQQNGLHWGILPVHGGLK